MSNYKTEYEYNEKTGKSYKKTCLLNNVMLRYIFESKMNFDFRRK